MSCTFSTSIAETLTCSIDGEFDHNGFPINECKLYPCQLVKEIESENYEKRNGKFSRKLAMIERSEILLIH